MKITVTEHNKIAYLSKGKHFYPILENGKILDGLESTEIPVFAPVLLEFKEGVVLNQARKGIDKITRRNSKFNFGNPSYSDKDR